MSDRSWFFASQDQQGPYPEAQLRDFIANGAVTAETLVWTEGMTGWQRAGEIPGLLSAGSGSPGKPYSGAPVTSVADLGNGSLSIDLGIWDLVWRSVVFLIGVVLIIPLPWVLVMYCRWIVSCTHAPARERPSLALAKRAFLRN